MRVDIDNGITKKSTYKQYKPNNGRLMGIGIPDGLKIHRFSVRVRGRLPN
jgi:hypothetical protein